MFELTNMFSIYNIIEFEGIGKQIIETGHDK